MKSTFKKAYKKVKSRIYIWWKFSHIKKQISCSSEWYGNGYGGFYVNPDLIEDSSIVYSFGIGTDVSFDKELIKIHNCRIFGFDPTPKSIDWVNQQNMHENFRFYPYGIAQETGTATFHLPLNPNYVSGSIVRHKKVSTQCTEQVEMKSFMDIRKALEHSRIDVLKMDIEGTEYDVINSILEQELNIAQIVVEFHERFFSDGKEKSIKLIDSMNKYGYKIFAVSKSRQEVSFVMRDQISN